MLFENNKHAYIIKIRIYDPSKHHFYFGVITFYPHVIVDSS
jgi:hypothetical protein